MTNASSSLADSGIKIVDIIGNLANIALKTERTVAPVVSVLAPFMGPYGPAVLGALAVADPIISRIAAAAPAVEGGIDAARPVIDAAQANAPQILDHVKEIMAAAFNADPLMGVHGLSALHISDEAALAFARKMVDGTKVQSIFEASFFTPQDERFARDNPSTAG